MSKRKRPNKRKVTDDKGTPKKFNVQDDKERPQPDPLLNWSPLIIQVVFFGGTYVSVPAHEADKKRIKGSRCH